jgi:hypothetical protein
MWAAFGFAMPVTPLKSQQVVPLLALKWTMTRPFPLGSPFTGVSFAPLSFAETTGLIAWPPASARVGTSMAAIASVSVMSLRKSLPSSTAPGGARLSRIRPRKACERLKAPPV